MHIREYLNRRPRAAAIGISVLFATAILFTVLLTIGGERTVSGPPQLYFTDDEGRTFFVDDSSRIPPFDRGGKTAYLAGVFQCENGQPIVCYLLRYTPEGKEKLAKFSASALNSSDPQVNEIKVRTIEVKAIGSNQWVPHEHEKFDVILAGFCPPGVKGTPKQVLPSD